MNLFGEIFYEDKVILDLIKVNTKFNKYTQIQKHKFISVSAFI